MAAVIGDFVSDLSRFHNMIVNPASLQNQHQNQHQHQLPQHQHQRHNSSSSPRRQRSTSRSSRTADDASSTRRSASRTAAAAPSQRSQPRDGADKQSADADADAEEEAVAPSTHRRAHELSAGGASRIPSPPPSSSPTVATGPSAANDAKSASMASNLSAAQRLSAMIAPATRQQPSPPADGLQIHNSSDVNTTRRNPDEPQQTVVHVRDLAHIQTLASTQILGRSSTSAAAGAQIKYEISGMPIGDIIEMVAALLTKITTTNDLQHDAMQRNVAHQQQANQNSDAPGGSHMSPLSHSVLAFHGKNVPAITILSYLSRIHKYCPTTYEVFLSLLVYFDRMTERVNDMVMKSEESRSRPSMSRPLSSHQIAPHHDATMRDNGHAAQDSDESDSDLADDDDEDDDDDMVDSPSAPTRQDSAKIAMPSEQPPVVGPATYFVVDSFNIHRLIIAGVTCASKFFSDVFYTNSRYAKVGGLPLAELNHLEIQFLVLNDFRLAVAVEDLEAYATMLVEFYAREVIAQNAGPESVPGA